MLDNFPMPKRGAAPEAPVSPEEDFSDVAPEEGSEEESPFAAFSDEEILAEAQARGLC